MKKYFILFCICFVPIFAPAQDIHLPGLLSECDYCIASQGISPVAVGSTGARYDFRYLRLQDMYESGKKIDNPSGDVETYVTHQVSLYYHITGALSASLFVPFASRSASGLGEPPHDPLVSGNAQYSLQEPQHHLVDHPYGYYASGLSDIMLMARYKLLEGEGESFFWTASGGVKLPTGKTNMTASEGELLNPHNQLGTGSTDYLLGTDLVYGGGNYSIVLNLLAMFPTEGAQSYMFGNMFNYSLTYKYSVLSFGVSSQLFAAASLDGEVHGKEKVSGEFIANTGGHTAYISPAVQLLWNEKISFDLCYHFPVIHQLYGTQLGETYKFMAGAQYLF